MIRLNENIQDVIVKTLKINQLYQNIPYKSTIIEEKYKVMGVWFTNRSLDFTQKSSAALYVQNLSQSRSVSTADKLKETKMCKSGICCVVVCFV